MAQEANGAGRFTSVTLRPKVTISACSDEAKVNELYLKAHAMCFIARSMNFPVNTEPTVLRAPATGL